MATISLPLPPIERACPWAEHTRFDPVFVLGHARSGTSLTCRLLLDHLGVNFGTESQFIIRHYQRLRRYGDLRDDRRLRCLLEEISRERFFERTRRNFGFVFDIDRAMRSIERRTYAGVLHAIFEQFAIDKGMTRWGDKTPEYSRHLPLLRELFPTAQYIHVVRDGRDVALSAFNTGFGPKSVDEAARAWSEQVRTIAEFGASLPSRDFLTIRYEDLLRQPAATLQDIGGFLGIANNSALIETVAPALRAQVRGDNAGKSSRLLPMRETECFEALAADVLERNGYSLRAGRGARPVTWAESVRWRARGAWRRASNRRYWADNYYKLRLRLRTALLSRLSIIRSQLVTSSSHSLRLAAGSASGASHDPRSIRTLRSRKS
jgi:hypothetical protein